MKAFYFASFGFVLMFAVAMNDKKGDMRLGILRWGRLWKGISGEDGRKTVYRPNSRGFPEVR
jgi:hypothetical protein